MKVRNAMCIFALFSIIALFFCFGVVANAAESGETETFTYSLSYEVPSNYTSNFIGTQFWNYGSFSLNYRLVILHHSDADVDVITSPDPDKVVVVSKNYNFYRLGNDGSLTSISSSGVSVSYTLRRVRRSNNEAETVNGNSKLQSFYASSVSTDIPIYEADEAGKAAALEYLKTGTLPEEIEDEELEAPKLVFTTQNRVFHIANSVDGYNVQIQGRFYSVDDIEMEKKTINAGVTWNYKYHTTLMGDLTDWVSVSSQTSCKEEFDILKGIGLEPLKAFLTKYPLDDRTIYGGKNSAGAWYTDRDKAVTQLKLSLSSVGVGLTQPELYVRFFYTDADGNTRYSKWTHWYGVLTNPDGTKSDILSYQSDTGLSDEEKDNLEKGGKPTENDTGTSPTYRDNDNGTSFWFKDFNPSNILTYFTNLIKTILSATSNIAPFFNSIFGFLPAELRNVVYVTISAGCFCALIRFIFGKG